jgi:hypothetical protein
MQRPQTFSPFRSSSSLSANRLALAYPRHQQPAFVLAPHGTGVFKRNDSITVLFISEPAGL